MARRQPPKTVAPEAQAQAETQTTAPAAQETAPAPKTDSEAMSDLPDFGFNDEAEAPAQAANSPEAGGAEAELSPSEQVPPAAFLEFNGKKFQSQAELVSYLTQLETEKAYRQGLVDAVTPEEPVAPPEEDPADFLLEDPKKAVALMEKKIRAELAAEDKIKDKERKNQEMVKNTWDSFYKVNPDLQATPEIVQLVAQQNRDTFGKLPVSQSLPELAKATRKYLATIRAKPNGGEELPSEPAITSGSGGVRTPKTEQVAVVSNFVEELRARNKRKQG